METCKFSDLFRFCAQLGSLTQKYHGDRLRTHRLVWVCFVCFHGVHDFSTMYDHYVQLGREIVPAWISLITPKTWISCVPDTQ